MKSLLMLLIMIGTAAVPAAAMSLDPDLARDLSIVDCSPAPLADVDPATEFSLGVRDRERRTLSIGATPVEPLRQEKHFGPLRGPLGESPMSRLQPNYGVVAWWNNSTTTTRVWSVVGVVLVVGISASAL
jgi:hypothetical protein